MCNAKDAERHEELARLQMDEGENDKARENYLEAASIYLLESEVKKDDSLVKKADGCYRDSMEAIGKKYGKDLTKKELARRTLVELDQIGKQKGEINMCGQKRIETFVRLAKKLEGPEPEKAAKNYLLAAEELLHQSAHEPEREDEYISLANKMYMRAKDLRNRNSPEDMDNKFRQGEVVKKSENKITFDDIGGLEALKEEIRFKIIEPFRKPDLFRYYKKPVGGGILMYGPPGCGKSLIAKATANEADATFIHVKCSDLKSKFVGETEKNIAELFRKAHESQPTIIFFDEFEALGCDRTDGLSHEKSAVAQLLTEIDGMDSMSQQILLLAATNEPWSIDPALRREGRFGKTIYVPPPDLEARKQIFSLVMGERPVEKIDCASLAGKTEGFSGADVKGICESATDIPLRESIMTGKRRKISMGDMDRGIDDMQSVMDQWFEKARAQVQKKNLEGSFKALFTDCGRKCVGAES